MATTPRFGGAFLLWAFPFFSWGQFVPMDRTWYGAAVAPACKGDTAVPKEGQVSAARFPGLPANYGKHRRPRLCLMGSWRGLVVHLFARWWRPPNNERNSKEADQKTRDEARDEPEQARHCLPPRRS